MAEVQELKSLVEKLQTELGNLSKNKDEEQVTKQFVVYKQERRLKKFSGKSYNDGNYYQKVEEFLSEVNAIFEARKMTAGEQVEFIVSHLDGPAREEIRLHPREDQNNPKKLTEILKKEFGEKHSLPELFKMFYNRKQKDQESLREYSHALAALFERIRQKSPADSLTDATLRDQFVDNVKDSLLRKELKKLIRGNSHISFLEIREEALKWSEEEVTQTASRQCKVQELRTNLYSDNDVKSCEVISASGSGFKELKETISRQQKMIEDLVKTVQTLKEQKRTPFRAWDKRKPFKNIECFNCRELGHIAKNCPNKSQEQERSSKPQQEQNKSSGSSNTSPPQH
uniref:Uncharacterized protein LOC116306938 n=1 Tax=Actinia tenebrosa TaxID=6105 RepID=A0A6P8J6M8_ACTTE